MTERRRGTTLPSDPHDRDVMREDVLAGLSRPQKEISSKYFYDALGSDLFERITELEEYYPTRTERALLRRWIPSWVRARSPASLVELGAGSAAKSRVILDAMVRHGSGRMYVPVDVSGDFLGETAEALRAEYPDLVVEPAVADMTDALVLGHRPPEPTWFALLGSTIGNFGEDAAVRLLGSVRALMAPGDRFLLGADRRPGPNKSVARLERAYDDALGVTAAFNRNVLEVLNRELGADFDPDSFRHHAFYDAAEGRIEMHLVAVGAQRVRLDGSHVLEIADGESIRTEISCKYDRPTLARLLARAGLEIEEWVEDHEGLFALVLGRPVP